MKFIQWTYFWFLFLFDSNLNLICFSQKNCFAWAKAVTPVLSSLFLQPRKAANKIGDFRGMDRNGKSNARKVRLGREAWSFLTMPHIERSTITSSLSYRFAEHFEFGQPVGVKRHQKVAREMFTGENGLNKLFQVGRTHECEPIAMSLGARS